MMDEEEIISEKHNINDVLIIIVGRAEIIQIDEKYKFF